MVFSVNIHWPCYFSPTPNRFVVSSIRLFSLVSFSAVFTGGSALYDCSMIFPHCLFGFTLLDHRLCLKRFKRGGRQTVCETTYPLSPHFYDENLPFLTLLVFALIHTVVLIGSLMSVGLDTIRQHHSSFIDSRDDTRLIIPTVGMTLLILCTMFQPVNAILLCSL